MTNESAIVVPLGEGRVLRAFGEEVIVLLDGEQTGGRQTMWLETTPPGGGPPLHFHINDDETFHVLEGQVAFSKTRNGTKSGRALRPLFHGARCTPSRIWGKAIRACFFPPHRRGLMSSSAVARKSGPGRVGPTCHASSKSQLNMGSTL